MKYNQQIDSKWKTQVMTQGTDYTGKSWIDYLGQGGYGNTGWGCVVTGLANMFQVRLGISFTPKRLNEILKSNKGYSFLKDPVNTPEARASFVEWGVIEDLFNVTVNHYDGLMYYREENQTYYLGRMVKKVRNSIFGHYVNIVGHDLHGRCWCFDTLSGTLEDYTDEITSIIQVKFNV